MGVSNFLSQVVQGATSGITGQNGVQDWKHASNIFVSGDLLRAPKYRGMFHVNYIFNDVPSAKTEAFKEVMNIKPGGGPSDILSVFTKSVDLPKFDIQYSTHNQYNKTTYTYKKMKYDPISITFHDDMTDYIWGLWAFYYAWYFSDATKGYSRTISDKQQEPNALANAIQGVAKDIYNAITGNDPSDSLDFPATNNNGEAWNASLNSPILPSLNGSWNSSWGLNGSVYHYESLPTQAFHLLKAIEIFPLGNKKASVIVLHNPKIVGWEHDSFDYSVNNQTATAKMQIVYEGVSYLDQVSAAGVLEHISYYDKHPSPLMSGSPRALLGPGGILDRTTGIIGNLASGSFGLGDVINAIGVTNAIRNPRVRDGISSELRNSVSNSARNASSNNFINKVFPGG